MLRVHLHLEDEDALSCAGHANKIKYIRKPQQPQQGPSSHNFLYQNSQLASAAEQPITTPTKKIETMQASANNSPRNYPAVAGDTLYLRPTQLPRPHNYPAEAGDIVYLRPDKRT